jgi:hypothetical protein
VRIPGEDDAIAAVPAGGQRPKVKERGIERNGA